MRTSLRKLREKGLAALKHDVKNKRRHYNGMPPLDELSQAQQDMQDIRDCYDRLLSAAAATANSAYEFSESLGEIGDCLLEKTSLSDFEDEESGKVLLMLGKVQFEVQRLVDIYRSHIFRTITIPSESLINELRVVEEMKKRCDVKREAYEELLKKHSEKGKLKNSKGECFSSHHLQIARDEYDEEANAIIFRMRSLKQGQCRSLLTQAARHHAAQLSFFRKAFKSLEAFEPRVKSVTEEQHIDYHFCELEDDDRDDNESADTDEDDADDGSNDDSELSFDCERDGQKQDAISKKSMELNEGDSPGHNSFAFKKEVKRTSKSAPLYADRKLDPAYRAAELRHSPSHRHTSYALPTPPEAKSPVSVISDLRISQLRRASLGSVNLWHSSPLDQNKYEKSTNEILSGQTLLDTKSVLKESNYNTTARPLTPPLTEGVLDMSAAYAKKVKRQAFSGPILRKPMQNVPFTTASGPIGSMGYPLPSRSLLHTPMSHPLSTPKLSSRASSTPISSPKISELHELPRPPPHLASRRPSTRIGYSGPLPTRGPELSATNRSVVSSAATTLPMPPPVISRSYSIPSRTQIEVTLLALKPPEASQNLQISEEIGSPTLAPISLSSIQPTSPAS